MFIFGVLEHKQYVLVLATKKKGYLSCGNTHLECSNLIIKYAFFDKFCVLKL